VPTRMSSVPTPKEKTNSSDPPKNRSAARHHAEDHGQHGGRAGAQRKPEVSPIAKLPTIPLRPAPSRGRGTRRSSERLEDLQHGEPHEHEEKAEGALRQGARLNPNRRAFPSGPRTSRWPCT
jgi:hypothetical protein